MNIASVELLNRSIENLGQTGANLRREQEAETHRRADESYRQQLVDAEIQRQKVAEAHYNQEQSNQDAYHKAALSKQDAILQNAQAQNAIKVMDKQYDQMRAEAPSDEEFNKAVRSFLQTHKEATDTILQNSKFGSWVSNPNYKAKAAPPHQAGQATAVAVDQQATALEDKADALEKAATSQPQEQGFEAGSYNQNPNMATAAQLRQRAKALRDTLVKGSLPGQQYDEVSTEVDTGLGGKKTLRQRFPAGQGASAMVDDAPANPTMRKAGTRYKTPDGKVHTWNGASWD